MKNKGFYIVGSVLLAVGAFLYFTKKKPTIVKEEEIVTGGESATIPPLEAPDLSTPPLVEDIWLTLKELIIKKQ